MRDTKDQKIQLGMNSPTGRASTNKTPGIMQVVQLNTRNGHQLDCKGKESVSWSLWTAPDRFRAILEEEDGLGAG